MKEEKNIKTFSIETIRETKSRKWRQEIGVLVEETLSDGTIKRFIEIYVFPQRFFLQEKK